jgi:hypothetical protein
MLTRHLVGIAANVVFGVSAQRNDTHAPVD